MAWSSLKKGTYDIIEKNIKEYILNQNEYPRNVLQAEFVIWQQEKTKMEIKEIESVLGNGVFEEGDLSQLKSCKRENVIIENAKKIIKVLV